MIILVMPSGFLFYANMPIFYFGILGLSVGIILLLMYIVYFSRACTREKEAGGEEWLELDINLVN